MIFLFLREWGAQHCHEFHPAVMPFPAHYTSAVLLPCEGKEVVLQGLLQTPQHLAMLQRHACCLFLKEIQVFMEEERKEETEIMFYSFHVCQKKFTNMLWSTNVVLYLPKATQRVLSKRERASRCLIRPWLGTSPGPRSKQSLAHDRSSPSRTFCDWFPSGGSQYFSHISFTWEIRWVKAVRCKSFSKSRLLLALSWSTSATKPCRKPGW